MLETYTALTTDFGMIARMGIRNSVRIGTCRKEARETKHFRRMTVRAVPELKSDVAEAVSGSQRIA